MTAASDTKGLGVRLLAADLLTRILSEQRVLDDLLESEPKVRDLAPRDRGFLLNLILTALRHRGEIEAVLNRHLSKPLPRKAGTAPLILWLAATQMLFLDTPAHAAIDMAVRAARADRNATHFSGLINAVLRKVSVEGRTALAGLDAPKLNTPPWLWKRWVKTYGEDTAHQIAAAHAEEPPLDIAVKSDPAGWAERLNATLLPTGHLRLPAGHGIIQDLPGFTDGEWWVQDAAAGLPALLLGDLRGKTALDLCAAPGGKTMQMIAGGATVMAVDSSTSRLARMRENLARTKLSAELIEADALEVQLDQTFDAVLLDAPCSATGTIRRHPELPYLKSDSQIGSLSQLQRHLIVVAARHVAPGGALVYSTCSLEPEEGEKIASWFAARHEDFHIEAPAIPGLPEEATASRKWLRILPHMSLGDAKGLDGFFAVKFRRV